MAKKNKDDVPQPNANSIVNRDIMQRLNFMYQASVYLSGVLPVPEPPASAPQKNRSKKSRKMTVHDLSKSYINSMKLVSNKTMVKMDPGVKRTLCNGCNIVLVPGSTASVRVKSSRVHGHLMSYRCNSCNAIRRIPAPPTLIPSDPAAVPAASTSEARMDVDADPDADSPHKRKRRRKSAPLARIPPLFARDVGHVVLRGNDTLPTRNGDGIYIT